MAIPARAGFIFLLMSIQSAAAANTTKPNERRIEPIIRLFLSAFIPSKKSLTSCFTFGGNCWSGAFLTCFSVSVSAYPIKLEVR